jgi:hypothetical protein
MIWSFLVILSPCWTKWELLHVLNQTRIALPPSNKWLIELRSAGACSCLGAIFGTAIVSCLFGYGHHC